MNDLPLIYTEKAECQDCYKCLRHCIVKAIQIKDGHATIIPEQCVGCGNCVEVCPVGAKHVRDDIERARLLLRMKPSVFVTLAPSWVAEFDGIPKQNMIAAIKRLGFAGVSETALGAQEVSANVAELLKNNASGVYLSSACPTVVSMVRKYFPAHNDKVLNMLSPVLAHAKFLRREFGDDIGVMFISPCVSKKLEADEHPGLVDVAITFEEIRRWWEAENIDPRTVTADEADRFVPLESKEGAIYPVDGGMIAGIKGNCEVNDAGFMAFSGIDNVRKVLDDIDSIQSDRPVFIELLACEGGCINGPRGTKRTGTAAKRFTILSNVSYSPQDIPRKPTIDISDATIIAPVQKLVYTDVEIGDTLRRIGKYSEKDELNCGGCGYDSCREFARALLDGIAETTMCVSYMRKLAQKKANAMLKTMPSGLVVVDHELKIVECNRRFAEMLGEDNVMVFESKPGLEGANLTKVAPFHELFTHVLKNGTESVEKEIRYNRKVLRLTVFTIEPFQLVGGVIQDITVPSVQKERIVNNARDVIQKNLETVQKIAYLLGENAADSEVILNSIINSFPVDSVEGVKTDDEE